ncbi:hypothetical protein [Croceibacterium mercuriale]|uniref:hypothetical protein n=1 Tax=Croceibacterium mercuriale TaxID=1572751 RepID=UPI00057D8689|nr:hypothetical protein [Croceibacterium mercuriale]
MDLNQLYFDHQLMLIRADRAPSCASRNASRIDASLLAARIGTMQRGLKAAAALSWEGLAAVPAHPQGCPA